jgi:hypothetical protein
MTVESKTTRDARTPAASQRHAPCAVAGDGADLTVAAARIAAPPEQVLQAFTKSEVAQWTTK